MACVGTLTVTVGNHAEVSELAAANAECVAAHQRFDRALAAFVESITIPETLASEPAQSPASPDAQPH